MLENREAVDRNSLLVQQLRDIGHIMRSAAEGRGSQKRILMIVQREGTITQRALTERLRIQYGSASEVLGKLESAGLICRTPNEADRRTTDITLTHAGESAAEEARKERKARQAQMFDCLSDEEKDALTALLEKVNAAWEQQYGKPSPRPRKSR